MLKENFLDFCLIDKKMNNIDAASFSQKIILAMLQCLNHDVTENKNNLISSQLATKSNIVK